LLRVPGKSYKSYLNQWIPPVSNSCQFLAAGLRNMRLFLLRRFHADAGLFNLFTAFYRSVAENAPLPIPYRDIVLTTQIMDQAFAQIAEPMGRARTEPVERRGVIQVGAGLSAP